MILFAAGGAHLRGDRANKPAHVVRGLSNDVRIVLLADPLSGHVVLFLNPTRAG